jgi:hypothetical protein
MACILGHVGFMASLELSVGSLDASLQVHEPYDQNHPGLACCRVLAACRGAATACLLQPPLGLGEGTLPGSGKAGAVYYCLVFGSLHTVLTCNQTYKCPPGSKQKEAVCISRAAHMPKSAMT